MSMHQILDARSHYLRPRSVRMPAKGVKARLGDQLGELVNLSLTGALLKLAREVPVGASFALTLSKRSDAAEISVEVVRTQALAEPREPPACLVGVKFLAVSTEARTMMVRLVAR